MRMSLHLDIVRPPKMARCTGDIKGHHIAYTLYKLKRRSSGDNNSKAWIVLVLAQEAKHDEFLE